MSETYLGNTIYKADTYSNYVSAGTIFPDNMPFVVIEETKRSLYIGTGGTIDTARRLGDESDIERIVAEQNALLSKGSVVDMSNYKTIKTPEEGIIYASQLSNIINPEHFEIFDSNRHSVNGIECFEGNTNIICTANWGTRGQIGFVVGDFLRIEGSYQYLIDDRQSSVGVQHFLFGQSTTDALLVYINGSSYSTAGNIEAGDKFNLIWTETTIKLYKNNTLIIDDELTSLAEFYKDACIGMSRRTTVDPINGTIKEFFYTTDTSLILNLIADKGIEYYPNGSYKDKLGQIRLQGDFLPYEESRDNRFITSPENGDIVYHLAGAGSNEGRIIHSNFMKDSVYPNLDKIWCGEEYENMGWVNPVGAHSSAIISQQEIQNGYRYTATALGIYSWIGLLVNDVSTISENTRYLSFNIKLISGAMQFKQGSSNEVKTRYLLPNGRYEVEITNGDSLFFCGSLFEAELTDIMVSTLSNAPYIPLNIKQPASAVKIDTSSWNKECGSFSFKVSGSTISPLGYFIDGRNESDGELGIIVYRNEDNGVYYLWSNAVTATFTEDIQEGYLYTLMWGSFGLKFYKDDVLLASVATVPDLSLMSEIIVGNRFITTEYNNHANLYFSDIVYKNTTELTALSAIDPRFKLYSDRRLIDHEGNSNDDVYFNRQLENLNTIKTWVVGEDIDFLNGWEHYESSRKVKINKKGTRIWLEGLMKNGFIEQTSFVLPEEAIPKTLKGFPVISSGSFGSVDVNITGSVATSSLCTNIYIFLDGITWEVD